MIKIQGKEPRPFTLNDYSKVLILKKQGLSQNKIKEKTGVSSTTVWWWTNTNRKPRFLYAKKQQRKIPKKAKILSKELAYIYGVLIGDGHLAISKLDHRINLNVSDKEFAIYFAKILKKWSGFNPTFNKRKTKKIPHQTKYGNWIKTKKDQYVVRLGSRQIVEFLSSKVKSRTYTWKVPKDILKTKNKRIIAYFLKGVFDSEGCVVYNKKYNKKRIDLRMYGKEVKTLGLLLKKIKIRSKIIQSAEDKMRGTFTLRIQDKKSLMKFDKMIGFTIKRKRPVLKTVLKAYRREPFDVEKTKKDIISSLKEKPKTISEISKDIGKSYSIVFYHLPKFLKQRKVKLINKELKDEIHSSRVWSIA